MASATRQLLPNTICKVCMNTPWLDLPNEFGGQAHHTSRSALEASAKTCPLCAMILRAAIANLQPDDDKRGRWRYFRIVMLKRNPTDEDRAARPYMIVRDLGFNQPAIYQESDTMVMTGTGQQGIKLTQDFVQSMFDLYNYTAPVVAHTLRYIKHDKQPQREALDADGKKNSRLSSMFRKLKISFKDATPTGERATVATEAQEPQIDETQVKDLPVWIYGNTWADYNRLDVWDLSRSKKCVMGFGARFGTSHRVMDAVNNPPGIARLRGSFIQIYTTDSSPLAQLIPSRLPEIDESSALSMHRIQSWLHNCKTNHGLCSAMLASRQRKLPTRVIDVSSATFSAGGVRLYESNGAVAEYIALSHTWGKSPRLRAIKENMQALRTGLNITDLPKTFQDAIQITRGLGIRYLWIDCLCIIQNDPQDWEQQAATMSTVYRDAYLTISASASSDSTSGCFPARDRHSYASPTENSMGIGAPLAGRRNQCTATYDPNPGKIRPFPLHFVEQWLPSSPATMPQSTMLGTFGSIVDPVASEPLSTRGWTLQERVLSPRTIHFASDELYFECESGMWSESGFELKNAQFSLVNCLRAQVQPKDQDKTTRGISHVVGVHVDQQGGIRHQQGWLSLIEDYSRRALSVASDKLLAVAGVARVIAEETGHRYLAGLWTEHLEGDMFWRVQTHEEIFTLDGEDDHKPRARLGSLIGHASRPAQVRAPSWSWAAVDGPIKFIPLSHSNLLGQLRLCYATATGVDEFGSVSGGFLDIEAPVFEVKRYTPNKEWPHHGMPAYIDLDDERGRVFGTIFQDLPQEELPENCYAVFLDPAHAIIVRSSQFTDGNLSPKRILCTTDLGPYCRKSPRDHTIVWLDSNHTIQVDRSNYQKIVDSQPGPATLVAEINHVVRLGVGSFFDDKSLDNNFEQKATAKPVQSKSVQSNGSKPTIWGMKKIDGKYTQVSVNPEDLRQVSGDQSWGVITKADARVPVSIR